MGRKPLFFEKNRLLKNLQNLVKTSVGISLVKNSEQ